jgi:TPR repeat protein
MAGCARAVDELVDSCSRGFALACAHPAILYRDGHGVVADRDKAAEFFRRA